jgi:lipopolysaccharide transport system ATP-binding protein
MSSEQIAIKVEKLSKIYQIYRRPQDRLKQFILPRLQLLMKKPLKTYFRRFWALQEVSFEVHKGETIGIIGRNGSGKSTLLQLICGTLTPTSGSVRTEGRIAALLELGSGFNPEFTGRENVYLNGALLGLSQSEIKDRFDDIAAFADIGEFIERPVKTYSSGMVVRLAFAVQSTIDPDILIVDEALAVGDEKFQRKCFARLEELKSRGTAILFVSHAGSQIVELCDKALLLEHGERLMYGRPATVVRAYQKIIYAPADQQAKLSQEYRLADQSGNSLNSNGEPELMASFDYKSTDQSPENITKSEAIQLSGAGADLVKADFFDPGLTPATTEVYPSQGAQILSVQILNMDGHVVNVIFPGREYRFQVSGNFLSDVKGVYFGLNLRSISGVVITGQIYPEIGKYIDKLSAGQNFLATFNFKMNLLPGVYFVACGVWSCYEPNCLHRILDALMFRVVPDGRVISFGFVDASSEEPNLVLT